MPEGLLAMATEIRAAPPTLAVAGLRGLQRGLDFRQVAGSEFSQGTRPLPHCFFAAKWVVQFGIWGGAKYVFDDLHRVGGVGGSEFSQGDTPPTFVFCTQKPFPRAWGIFFRNLQAISY